MLCYGTICYGLVRYGMVWYGMVWNGMVWTGMAWYGITQCRRQVTLCVCVCVRARVCAGLNRVIRAYHHGKLVDSQAKGVNHEGVWAAAESGTSIQFLADKIRKQPGEKKRATEKHPWGYSFLFNSQDVPVFPHSILGHSNYFRTGTEIDMHATPHHAIRFPLLPLVQSNLYTQAAGWALGLRLEAGRSMHVPRTLKPTHPAPPQTFAWGPRLRDGP